MSHVATLAALAFERTLEELERREDAPDLGDPAALGCRAALLATADAVRGHQLGPLFDIGQVKILLGVDSRQAVSDLTKRGRLLALGISAQRKLYPAFQFGPGGWPYPELASVLAIFAGVIETPYTVAFWLISPQDLLEGETPLAWMRVRRDSERLLEAARRAAAPLAH